MIRKLQVQQVCLHPLIDINDSVQDQVDVLFYKVFEGEAFRRKWTTP